MTFCPVRISFVKAASGTGRPGAAGTGSEAICSEPSRSARRTRTSDTPCLDAVHVRAQHRSDGGCVQTHVCHDGAVRVDADLGLVVARGGVDLREARQGRGARLEILRTADEFVEVGAHEVVLDAGAHGDEGSCR